MTDNSKEKQQQEEDFRILAEFMERFAIPAEGHARENLTAEQEDLLRRLAAGELDAESRAALIPLLARNEIAMEFLAKLAA